jgi:hypothetical protein
MVVDRIRTTISDNEAKEARIVISWMTVFFDSDGRRCSQLAIRRASLLRRAREDEEDVIDGPSDRDDKTYFQGFCSAFNYARTTRLSIWLPRLQKSASSISISTTRWFANCSSDSGR